MNAPNPGVVIIGSGLGAYTLAREFRKLDKLTPVTLITADGGQSYSKPMLSNAFAQGKDAKSLVMKDASQMARDLDITVLPRHRVSMIDRGGRTVTAKNAIGDDLVLAYDKLVLAVGADPRPYVVEGGESVRIHTVNDLDDYAQWRDGLHDGARILLIGAGLIGSEFANDLAGAGFKVSIVDPAPWPLGRLLPEQVGQAMAQALTQAGIALHMGRSLTRLKPGLASLDDGSTIAFDKVLSAIGLVPRTRLAAAAGLATDKGILVDSCLRSSDLGIYALGDCAESPAGPLPFVLPLMAQARALAATIAGTETPLVLPALPVVVKTPCLPLAVCPPPFGAKGDWVVEGAAENLKALFVTETGTAIGFALSGRYAAERQSLAKDMPALLG